MHGELVEVARQGRGLAQDRVPGGGLRRALQPAFPVAHVAGQLLELAVGPPVGLGHGAQRALGLEEGVVGHHGHPVAAVALEHLLDDGIALIPGEVDVHVRRILALLGEEALEHEVRGHGIHVAEAQGVAHQGGRAAAPPADAGRRALGGLHDVLHQQEVAGEALEGDEVQLPRHAGEHVAIRMREARRHARPHLLAQEGVQVRALAAQGIGQHPAAPVEGPAGDLLQHRRGGLRHGGLAEGEAGLPVGAGHGGLGGIPQGLRADQRGLGRDGPLQAVHLQALGRAEAQHLGRHHGQARGQGLPRLLGPAGMGQQGAGESLAQERVQPGEVLRQQHAAAGRLGFAEAGDGQVVAPRVGLGREQPVERGVARVADGQRAVGVPAPVEARAQVQAEARPVWIRGQALQPPGLVDPVQLRPQLRVARHAPVPADQVAVAQPPRQMEQLLRRVDAFTGTEIGDAEGEHGNGSMGRKG